MSAAACHTAVTGRARIVIAGVGGQGTITATIVIGEAALAAGLDVVTSELHGMAQRGGVVQSTVCVGMYAATVPDGTADVLLGFEPVETLRFVAKAHPERTTIITNTRPIIPVSAVQGRTRYPEPDTLWAPLAAAGRRLVTLDAVALAAAAGTPKALGAVLVGALAGLGVLAVPRACWINALIAHAPRRFREANLAGFDAGFATTCSS
jgi:indolepyruvate ferredoxin oxidoreductase beta subunit